MSAIPPPHVAQAAAIVDGWLREVENRQLTAEEIRKLSPAEKLDYSRKFNQAGMPAWQDPRTMK
ncbi:hypothetical protein [Bradyrhizobium sp. SZCCHNS2015]|uniref:hypothetical protein n=1 Tax=Bradyrhizobium sp. SZCCHNS2015 TaxID=3057305 RepID=UPI0028E8FF4F|nr:hypothetical protein [Bradyrhizobium sp. SZCCHNS2015]